MHEKPLVIEDGVQDNASKKGPWFSELKASRKFTSGPCRQSDVEVEKKVSFHYKLRFFRVKLLIYGVNPPCFPNFGEFNHHLVLHPSLGQGTTSSLALAAEPMAAETAPKLPERKTRRKCSDELFFDIFGYYCYILLLSIYTYYVYTHNMLIHFSCWPIYLKMGHSTDWLHMFRQLTIFHEFSRRYLTT